MIGDGIEELLSGLAKRDILSSVKISTIQFGFFCRPHSCSFTFSFIHSFIHTINLSLFFTTLLWAFGLNFKQIPHINCKLYVIMGSPSNQHIPIERPKYTQKESITVSPCRKDLVNTYAYTHKREVLGGCSS